MLQSSKLLFSVFLKIENLNFDIDAPVVMLQIKCWDQGLMYRVRIIDDFSTREGGRKN